MKQLVATLCVLAVFQCYAQNGTVNQPVESLFKNGIEYYEQGQYNQAREKFEQYLRSGKDRNNLGSSAYYRAMSALKLYHNDGEYLMESFLESYPFHSKAGLAYYEIGNYFYQNQKYKKAVSYFKKANVTSSYQDDLAFKLGYGYFNLKQMPLAADEFAKVDQVDSEYYYAANYYRGFIRYKQDSFDEALEALSTASGSEEYIGSSALMIASIHLENEDYNKCVNFSKRALSEGFAIDPKLYYVQGNAYLKLNQHKSAIESFESGLSASNRKAQPAVYFNLAEAYRLDGQMEKATDYYSFSALDKDEIGHYSSYYLGKLYLGQENYEYAKSAFWQALKSEEKDIREESTFQLIKVEFKLGEYKECIEGAKNYQTKFPDGKYHTEVNEFLTEAFLNTSDYDLAIQYIENLESISPAIENTYQKVTFQKASDQFNNSRFKNAIYFYDKSLKYNQNKLLNIKAHYWKGEAFSIGQKYEQAIASYKSALYITENSNESKELKNLSRYGLGYCYFNSKDYENASSNFKTFLASYNDKPNLLADAKTRLGDCYYVSKDYVTAIATYQSLLNQTGAAKDYVNFQLGVVYALNEQPQLAKNHYQTLLNNFPESSYRDNGIFQLAELQFESGDYTSAVAGFSKVISEYPDGQLTPYALLKRAVANYNLGKYPEAESDYKTILNNHISHKAANGALLGLQELYALTGDGDDFSSFLEKYKAANPNDESLESIEFDAAKSLYYNQRYEPAIKALQDFRSKYTASSFNTEAGYLIAESYYRTLEYDFAIEEFVEVVSDKSGKYLNRSLYRLGSLYALKEDHNNALQTFKELESYSKSKRDIGNSWSGQMFAYYSLNELDSAIAYAEKISESPKMNQDAKSRAILLIGNIYSDKAQYDLAADQYLQLMNDIKDENGANAHYGLALVYFKQQKYRQSIETCFELNKQYASYDQWLGKSFLLIADNYIAMDELFQAKATLNSIVEKSPVKGIVDLANTKLLEIEELEKAIIENDDEVDSLTNTNDNEG